MGYLAKTFDEMFRKPGVFFWIFFGCCFSMHAQTQILNLTKQRAVILRDYYIDTVIIAQQEKELLGFDLMHRAHIRFNSTIEKDLNAFFNRQDMLDKSKEPLILKVNRIRMESGMEWCRTELGIGLIVKENDKYVELITTSAITGRDWWIANSEKKLGETFVDALVLCLKDFVRRKKNGNLVPKPVEVAYLNDASFHASNYPVFSQPATDKGVFYSYSEFLDRAIDTSIRFTLDTLDRRNRLKLTFIDLPTNSVWGFSDGSHYYHRPHDDYYQLRKNPQSQIWDICLSSEELIVPITVHGAANLDSRGEMGRLIGYGRVRAFDNFDTEQEDLSLDSRTGGLAKSEGFSEVVFDCYGDKDNPEICFYREDSLIACINSGEFFRFKYAFGEGIIRLTLKSGNLEREIRFDPEFEHAISVSVEPRRIVTSFGGIGRRDDLEKYLARYKKEVFPSLPKE